MKLPKTWKQKNGKRIKISEMNEYHIKNTLRMLERYHEQTVMIARRNYVRSDNPDYCADIKEKLIEMCLIGSPSPHYAAMKQELTKRQNHKRNVEIHL